MFNLTALEPPGQGQSGKFSKLQPRCGPRNVSRGSKRRFSVADHVRMTEGVECRKDADVIDETPVAYKSIEAVMAAQADLVEIVHTLRQVVCVKG
jgi:tRNA-splicing ligase RtcB (3'-phosphate/5'-hydroxy nucleic acid ligase)